MGRAHEAGRGAMTGRAGPEAEAQQLGHLERLDDLQRVEVLPTMPLADELVQPPFAIQPADGLNCTRWRACQLQQRSSGVF